MDAIIVSIGSELTFGTTIDTNSAWLAGRLGEIGIRVVEHLTVADELQPIRQEIDRACRLADVVLVTGGLGPTEDDLTRHALAEVMGVELQLHTSFVERIRTFFTRRGVEMPEANLVQAKFPVGSEAIPNACGTAPGIHASWQGAELFAMPGVPREMREMYERSVRPLLVSKTGGASLLRKNIWCFGAGESSIGERIADLMQRGRNPTVGTTAQHAVIGIRIVSHGATKDEAQRLLDETAAEVRRRLGVLVFGEDCETLADAVAHLLKQQRRTVATAESCTGGLIAKSLTDVSGSSDYFLNGFVTYSNDAKTRWLDVSASLMAGHGAVSPQVAEAMAVNCRRLSGTDFALSVTGIAGPTGGSPDKPVGLVYIGLADENGCEVTEHRVGDYLTRDEIRDRTHKIALNRLRLRLLQA